MFLLHLNTLLDLLLCGLRLLVFLCQPASKHKHSTAALCSLRNPDCLIKHKCKVCVPFPLFKLPVQSCQCELVGIILCKVGPGNLLRCLLVKLLLTHEVYLLMLRPGTGREKLTTIVKTYFWKPVHELSTVQVINHNTNLSPIEQFFVLLTTVLQIF